MLEFLWKLFDTSDFPARWHCGNWSDGEGWLHIISDLATWGAYMAIPLVLLYFAQRRRDIPFNRLIYLFATFILACGTVHLVEAIIFWHPIYRVSGLLKLITAVSSWGTVVALVRVAPLALELPSIKTANEQLRQEISQRSEAEKRLAKSELRFRSTFENAAVGMAHVSIDGEWLQVNERLCQIVGYAREQLLKKTFQDITHPDDLQADLDLVKRTLAGEINTYTIEKRYFHSAGFAVWVNLTVSLVRDDAGQPSYFITIIEDITDRIRAEQMLKRSHSTFMNLVEEAPFGVFMVDADFVLQQVSKGAQKVFANVHPLLGRDFAEVLRVVWPEPFASEAVEIFWNTLETGESFVSPDTTEQRIDIGEVESYHWQLERIAMPDDRLGVVCYFYETTQLKRAEQALRQNEARQSLLLSFLQAGRESQNERKMLATAAETLGKHLHANRVGFAEVVDEETMTFGACWTDGTIPVLEGTSPQSAMGTRFASELAKGHTIGIADIDSDPRTVDSRFDIFGSKARLAAPIMRDGRWQAALYISQTSVRHWTTEEMQFVRKAADQIWDVVEKTRSMQALEVSESRLRLATKLARVGVLHCDYVKNTITLDETAASLFDLPADVALPREQLHSRFHPEDAEWLLHTIDEVTHPGGTGAMLVEHRVVHSDGSVQWLDVSKQVFYSQGDDGRLVATLSTVATVDVTDQRNHEARLEEARLIAESANRARGEFLANMSHEIRTPMTAILGYTDLLSGHLENPDDVQAVKTIQRNGRYLLEIINDILDISKIDAGKMEIESAPISLQDLVSDAISLMNVRAQEKRVDLGAEFQGRIPKLILTDSKRLRQILLNLIGNAVKFTQKGKVQLAVRFDEQDGKLEFEISDTGIGIKPNDLEKLFQPFIQVDASNTRIYGGTGLGLAISRRLAQMLGGDIRAESEFGKGSTFTCSIDPGPIDADSLIEVQHVVSETQTPQFVNVRLEGHYLIVDDRRDIRFLAQNFIEQSGGTVSLASNGKEGIEAVEKALAEGQVLNAILMDMQMPVLDGYAATAELRKRGVTTPIIALTANAMDGDADKCLQVGCNAFLSKPIDRNALLRMLSQYS